MLGIIDAQSASNADTAELIAWLRGTAATAGNEADVRVAGQSPAVVEER